MVAFLSILRKWSSVMAHVQAIDVYCAEKVFRSLLGLLGLRLVV
jgi:hypothetical protein